jgi:hypothetical protein
LLRPLRLGAVAKAAVVKNAPQISFYANKESIGRSSEFDPRIHFADAPIVGGNGIRPVPVSPVQLCQIGSSDRAILRQIKSIPTTDICCRGLADLHGSLGPGGIRTPHTEIFAMARLSAVDRGCDAIERRSRCHFGVFGCMLARVFLPIESGRLP